MSDGSKPYRQERIERILADLQYEVTRAVMEREIDPRFRLSFFIPWHDGGFVTVSVNSSVVPVSSIVEDDKRSQVVGKNGENT